MLTGRTQAKRLFARTTLRRYNAITLYLRLMGFERMNEIQLAMRRSDGGPLWIWVT
jgi:hypothetical protein